MVKQSSSLALSLLREKQSKPILTENCAKQDGGDGGEGEGFHA